MVFESYADYYDLLYKDKNYAEEIGFIESISGIRPGCSVLDLGSGTGGHAIPLAERGYSVTGIDLSAGMVEQARKKARERGVQVRFLQGDIRDMRLDTQFDLVVSMFAVMGYQTSNGDFAAALRTAHTHLPTGGAFLFDVWYGPAVLNSRPETRVKEVPVEGGTVIRIATPTLDGLQNTVTVNYRVLTLVDGKVADETIEAHRMRYFFAPEVAMFAEGAGFEVSKLCAFMEPDRLPAEMDWNATWVLKAV